MRGLGLEVEGHMIDLVAEAKIATLPEPARARTLRWLADGESWGWKLLQLDIECIGDRLHVAMHFNVGDVDIAVKMEGRRLDA
jgi:hypothetical protein